MVNKAQKVYGVYERNGVSAVVTAKFPPEEAPQANGNSNATNDCDAQTILPAATMEHPL